MSHAQMQRYAYSLFEKASLLVDKFIPQAIVAVLLVSVFLLEASYGPSIKPLVALQHNELYKQITGFLLLVYVLYQWRLALLRMRRERINHNHELNLHMWFGALTPLALYVHSSQLGYGYQVLLAGALLFSVLFGLCSPKLLKIRHKTYVVTWMVIHGGVAVLVPLLLIYHLYVIYFYE